jgi:hypothetical protein
MKKIILITLCMAVSGVLFAQTAAELETILDSGELTFSQAASFVLNAADVSYSGDAFAAARENGWLPAQAESGGAIRLGELSLLIMKSFGLRGGVMYGFFPNSRYACRELVYLQIIQGRNDPGAPVDGRTFLHILGRALTHAGGGAEDI